MKRDYYTQDVDWFLDKYLTVYDCKNTLLCEGKIVSVKSFCLNKKWIVFPSVDNHTFFNLNSMSFKIKISDIENKTTFVSKCLNKQFSVYRLRKINQKNPNISVDIILDNDIYHLDKYVDVLVYALNNVGIKTDGSCSGHYKFPLYVSCSFETIEQIIKLRKILADQFNDDFYIRSQKDRSRTNYSNLNLSIVSYHKGKTAYRAAERLAVYLNNFY